MATNTSTVILTETELFDGASWRHVAWADAGTGDAAPAPGDYPLPAAAGRWISDWKIVTGAARDEFGWEYRTNRLRKRTWIRTHEVAPEDVRDGGGHRDLVRRTAAAAAAARTDTLSDAVVFTGHGPSRLSSMLRAVRDSYNFKGFGMTFYKSLVFPRSCGLALRLPLTYNFNLWEEHPSLPSIGASVAVYYPWMACLFINASLRMEVIQWAVTTSVGTVIYVACWLVWTLLLRGLIVAGAALLFPLTRRLYQPSFPLAKPNWLGPEYSRTVEERLGISVSWRVSQARGYEYRVGYWHYMAHSLVALLKAWNVQRIPAWVVRRVAAVGTSISSPIPDPPFMTANSLLALSGIYFGQQNKPNPRQSQSDQAAASSKPDKVTGQDQNEEESPPHDNEDEAIRLVSRSIQAAKVLSGETSKTRLLR